MLPIITAVTEKPDFDSKILETRTKNINITKKKNYETRTTQPIKIAVIEKPGFDWMIYGTSRKLY